MTTKHTPLPWETTHDLNDTFNTQIWNSGTETLIADCDMLNGQSAKTSQANAAFIVKAVNCHYELLEALKMVRDADEDCKKDGLPRWCTDIARAKIDAAIAKAEQ